MIYAMKGICTEWEGKCIEGDLRVHESKINKGISLFGKYFRHLWW
jgi:hypothetical protein